MNWVVSLAIVGAGGFIAGAAVVDVLHAQTSAAPPAFLISNIEEIKDDSMWTQYRNAAPATEAAYGGHAIVRANPLMIDSSPSIKGHIVVIQFPSIKALKDWWSSPAYSALRPLREKSTVGHLYAVEGLPAP